MSRAFSKMGPGVSIFNVATGKAHSMDAMIQVMGKLLDRPIKVNTDPGKVRGVERAHLQADIEKLSKLLGRTPSGDLEKGLKKLLVNEGLLKE